MKILRILNFPDASVAATMQGPEPTMHAELNMPHLVPSFLPSARRLGLALLRFAAGLAAPRHKPPGATELRAMGDLELRDLGLGRSDIPYVLRASKR